ncbi:MAG: acyl-CoA dehydratase activase [Pseudomonadota bacterium]
MSNATLAGGLDVGSLWTKAVVLRGGEVVGWSVALTGERSSRAAEKALKKALEPVGASMGDVAAVVATGAGKKEVSFARQQAAEVVCLAKGAARLCPGARGVIDMGGESTRVVKMDEAGSVMDYALNDKCAAGTGVFLDAMAKVLKVGVEEMGPLSLESDADVNITSTCVAFAESEVVSLIHRQTPKRDILRGIHRSIATRVFGMVNRIGLEGTKAAVGGLSLNTGIVACLEDMIKDKLTIPENPQIASALGAALIAAGLEGGE